MSGFLCNTNSFLLSPFPKPTPPTRKSFLNVKASSSPSINQNGGGNHEAKLMIVKERGRKNWTIESNGEKPCTPLLDRINYPIDMKNLASQDLEQLSAELRAEVIHSVSQTGGHLSSSLGVVELTVALHRVFNAPEDKIIWDVGHQTYPHKILTGRRSRMRTIRQTSGLAPFPKRDESIYDAFGVGHSSTSISAGLGIAVARDLSRKSNHVISVIGDGGMTAGQPYEAINNAGYLNTNLIVVLNDNNQVSLPTAILDGPIQPIQARRMLSASKLSLFEELGFCYIGLVDGHNVEDLVKTFENVKSMPAPGPVLIHVVTEKGKGYRPAERADDKMHGVEKFDTRTGKQFKTKSVTPSYSQYFAESLIKEAEVDNKIVAIHAAMGSATGLNYFQKRFPDRCFDVGIAEQHAVTFAAGLATEGLKPFFAVYSSFLQRGFDQVVHDVDLQKLPVRFAITRAGFVGADGPTHCGAFDITYMACLPNMVVMAPSDEVELMHMVATAAAIDDKPSCFRFPKGDGIGAVFLPNNKGSPLEIGKGRILMQGSKVAILGFGSIVQQCIEAANMLKSEDVYVTVADARFCKPLDTELIRSLVKEHEILITVEEGSIGGFSSHVSHFLSLNGLLDGPLKLRAMVLPDRHIDHGSIRDQLEEAGLTSRHIYAKVQSLLGRNIGLY
ncbi:hypothetical protein MKX01_002156 [Papaver californicum]|nr:hypothetical protein MKX01_002156 [Papaver californicum]